MAATPQPQPKSSFITRLRNTRSLQIGVIALAVGIVGLVIWMAAGQLFPKGPPPDFAHR